MLSSRVIVKGLPPSLTESEIRAHFAARFAVTDLRSFPARRICFLGFESPQIALQAIKYFHRSFIRMSRIIVEAVDETANQNKIRDTSRRGTSVHDRPTQNNHQSLKRKRSHASLVTNSDNSPGPAAESAKIVHARDVKESENRDVDDSVTPHAAEEASNQLQQGSHNGTDYQIDVDSHLAKPVPSNDVDWMRSKTIRLLGLADADDNIATDESQVNQPSTPAKNASATTGNSKEHKRITRSENSQSPENALIEHRSDKDGGRRLFVRNLPFNISEEDLQELFHQFGELSELTIPYNFEGGTSKGIAFVEYVTVDQASEALSHLDGTTFRGRLLHLLHAQEKRDKTLDDWALAQLPIKRQRLVKRKAELRESFNWNSMFMNIDAVVASVASRLGVSKAELLDPSASDAAVKQAQAETYVIRETKEYFQSQGVNLASLAERKRDGTGLLIKNFPFGTTSGELFDLCSKLGQVHRVLVPPAGTIAIIEFKNNAQARHARDSLAYSQFKGSVLYPEQVPANLFNSSMETHKNGKEDEEPAIAPSSETEPSRLKTSTLFVRNLNFATTNERLKEFFAPLQGFISARIKTKRDTKEQDRVLSMGFGFAEFRSRDQAHAAMMAVNGHVLDGRTLEIKESNAGVDAAEETRELDRNKKHEGRKSKLIIKNLPFEISKKELRDLIKPHGQVRAVRLPKKFDNSRKGFAFAEFTSPREAENVMHALQNTHLLGRRLVIDFASGEAEDPEGEIAKMQQKVGSQTKSIALQQLTASERRKFILSQDPELPTEG